MKVIKAITLDELDQMAKKMYGELVKGVVDINKNTLVLDAEMHADEEAYLLEHGSAQQDLWGINLYPAKFGTDDFVEFDSMINIRPSQHNRSRGVEDKALQQQIRNIITSKVKP